MLSIAFPASFHIMQITNIIPRLGISGALPVRGNI